MFPVRFLLAGLFCLLPLLAVRGQVGDADDYRRFYKTPETSLEFWNALQVELDKGSYELAGKWLRGLMDRKPTDKDLTQIADKDGTITVLRLRNVRNWTNDPNVRDVTVDQAKARLAQAKADKEGVRAAESFLQAVTLNTNTMQAAETLIEAVQAAVRKRAGDADFIRGQIAQLTATPEERTFAIRELYKIGPNAVPYLLEAIDQADDAGERVIYRATLERMGSQTLAPLVAALEGYKPTTRLDVLDLLRSKHGISAAQIAPFLIYPSASKSEDPTVRAKALALYSDFTETPKDRLPPAKFLLTREAEKYARGEIAFSDPKAVTIWRYDDRAKMVMPGWPGATTVTASQAEEYYGLRFARQALDLDPNYLPAQTIFLTLALDKVGAKHGLAKPLAVTAPALNEQVNKADLDLLLEVLDRALRQDKPAVALPILRVIAARAEVRARKPLSKGEPAVVRALYAKEPRVRLAAVQALLAIPGTPEPTVQKRVLEILGHMLTPKAVYHEGRKVLVAIGDATWRNKAKRTVLDLGAIPVEATNGRDAMRLLRNGADIEAILLDSTLPMPGLAHLLAQLRADADLARLPIFLAAVPETRAADTAARRFRQLNVVKDSLEADLTEYRRRLRNLDTLEEAERREFLENTGLDRSQRNALLQRVERKYRDLRAEAERMNPGVENALARMQSTENEIAQVAQVFDLEAQVREEALRRFVSRYSGVTVVPTTSFNSADELGDLLKTVADDSTPLAPEEQAAAAELSIALLRGMAYGIPPGYDVQPLTAVILDTLRQGRLSPEGQQNAIDIARKLPGSRPQQELAQVILEEKRPAPVRVAAARGLLAHRQRFGIQLNAATVERLRAEAARVGVDGELKEQLDLLMGSLGADPRPTGDRLRDYNPLPVAPLPPPKKEDGADRD